jgi:VanZ family protein
MDEKTAPGVSACRTDLSGWLPPVVWAALIFALSAQPNLRFVPDQGLDFVVRKVGHMGVFGILVLLVWSALSNTSSSLRRPWAWALALVLLYAATDELHQGFVAGRHPSVVDVAIDGSGALIALAVAGALRSRR